ncbi:MAG TPA: hypothetical protein VFM14_06905 [Gemmatimonadales bacterium]|nr:hypothetical protein [Gemmatimonadales bacterium]
MFPNLRPSTRGLAALAAVVTAGCNFAPEGYQPMEPPPQYRAWFAETEACSGRAGNFDRLVFHVVEGESFECPSGRCVGRWNDNHHIYIASAYVNNELVVRHEMLHDLLGRPGHPDPPFGNGCPLTWEAWRDAQMSEMPPSGRLAATTPLHID